MLTGGVSDSGGAPSTGGSSAGGEGTAGQGVGGEVAGGDPSAGGVPSTGGASGDGGSVTSGGAGGSVLGGADWATTELRVGAECGNSICHGGTEMLCLAKDADRMGGPGSFCQAGSSLYETLLSTRVKECGDVPLVDPGSPDTSAIVLLMTRKCGDFVMPANCPPEDQGYPTCWPEYAVLELRAWIENGAPRAGEL